MIQSTVENSARLRENSKSENNTINNRLNTRSIEKELSRRSKNNISHLSNHIVKTFVLKMLKNFETSCTTFLAQWFRKSKSHLQRLQEDNTYIQQFPREKKLSIATEISQERREFFRGILKFAQWSSEKKNVPFIHCANTCICAQPKSSYKFLSGLMSSYRQEVFLLVRFCICILAFRGIWYTTTVVPRRSRFFCITKLQEILPEWCRDTCTLARQGEFTTIPMKIAVLSDYTQANT